MSGGDKEIQEKIEYAKTEKGAQTEGPALVTIAGRSHIAGVYHQVEKANER